MNGIAGFKIGKHWSTLNTPATLLPILVALAVSLSTACTRELSDAEYLQRAEQYHANGEFGAAVIELKNALALNADNLGARWLLGQIYLATGNGASAEKELLRAQQLGLSEETVKLTLGEALLLQMEFRKVLDQVRVDAKTSARNLHKVLRIRGDAELGLGNLELGCAFFSQSRDADPDYAPAYLGLAKCALRRKDMEGARGLIEKALALDPEHSASWLLLGRLERIQGQLKEAEAALRKAVETNPYNALALFEHAGITLTLDDIDAFGQDLVTFRTRYPHNFLTYYLQAQLDIREGRIKAAQDNLQEVISKNPNHLPSLVLLGAVQLDLGSPKLAENELERAVAMAPGSAPARRLLAQAQIKNEQPERALQTLRPLLSVEKPEVGDLNSAGEAYLRLGDIDRAKKLFALAQQSNPDSAGTQINLARTNLASGELEQALQHLEVAAEIDPDRTTTDKLLVLSHLTAGEYEKALEAAQRLVAKSPGSAFAHHLQGAVYLGKKDSAMARQAFEQALSIEPTFTLPLLKLADIDVLENQPEKARQRLEAGVKQNDEDFRLMLALARLAQQAGDQIQAFAWVEKATKAAPTALEPRESLVPLLIAKQQATAAVSVAKEAVRHNPGNPKALNLLGMAQMAAGDPKGALASYQRLVAMLPDKAVSHFQLGKTLMLLGRYDDARKSLTTALDLAPNSLGIQATLGVLENQVGRPEEAMGIAREIQRTHPKYHSGYMLEGDIAMAQGKTAEAIKPYETAFAKAGTGKALLRLARAMEAANRDEEAESQLLEWLESHPSDREARLHLAGYYDQQDQHQRAISQYEALARQFPNDALTKNNLAALYQRTDDPRALPTAEQAHKLRPNQPAILDTLGWMLVQQGQTQRGLQLLAKAVTKAPKNQELRFHYASALAAAGEKDKAKEELRELLASGPFPQETEARALFERL